VTPTKYSQMDWKKKAMPKTQKTSLQAVTRLLPQRLAAARGLET